MPATMRAAIVPALKAPLEIREIPIPEVTSDRILVKVEACGVCHTDRHAAEGDWPVQPQPPFSSNSTILGHCVRPTESARGDWFGG